MGLRLGVGLGHQETCPRSLSGPGQTVPTTVLSLLLHTVAGCLRGGGGGGLGGAGGGARGKEEVGQAQGEVLEHSGRARQIWA